MPKFPFFIVTAYFNGRRVIFLVSCSETKNKKSMKKISDIFLEALVKFKHVGP